MPDLTPDEASNMISIVILYASVFGFSVACAMFRKGNGFSTNIFLGSMVIGMTVLVWMPVVPTYMIVIPILILVGMIFSDQLTGGDSLE